MSRKELAQNARPRSDYVVCVDIVAILCILAIASRPDGLAITISAVIVAIVAMICRCLLSTKPSDEVGSTIQAKADLDRKLTPKSEPGLPSTLVRRQPGRHSWLRDAD